MTEDDDVSDPEQVLRFWLEECGPKDWYAGGDALDDRVRERLEATWKAARAGCLVGWRTQVRSCLAFLIVTDQFPRNMFRGSERAFATDVLALEAAKQGISNGFDLRVDGPARQFFYLPLEHSECVMDQDRAVRLICTRMEAPETLLHARAHRHVIRRFGRFPHRNAALGRESSDQEAAFLDSGGYRAAVEALRQDA